MSADSAFNTDVGFWLLKLQVLQEDHVLPQRQPEQEASHTACSTRLAKPCPPTGELSLGGGSDIIQGELFQWLWETMADRGDPGPSIHPTVQTPVSVGCSLGAVL